MTIVVRRERARKLRRFLQFIHTQERAREIESMGEENRKKTYNLSGVIFGIFIPESPHLLSLITNQRSVSDFFDFFSILDFQL